MPIREHIFRFGGEGGKGPGHENGVYQRSAPPFPLFVCAGTDLFPRHVVLMHPRTRHRPPGAGPAPLVRAKRSRTQRGAWHQGGPGGTRTAPGPPQPQRSGGTGGLGGVRAPWAVEWWSQVGETSAPRSCAHRPPPAPPARLPARQPATLLHFDVLGEVGEGHVSLGLGRATASGIVRSDRADREGRPATQGAPGGWNCGVARRWAAARTRWRTKPERAMVR